MNSFWIFLKWSQILHDPLFYLVIMVTISNYKASKVIALSRSVFCRGVVAESEDIIKESVNALTKQGFINYFGLQVYPDFWLLFFLSLIFLLWEL